MIQPTRERLSSALSPGESVTDHAIAAEAGATAFRITTTNARSPAAAGSTPLLIQPPRSAAAQTSCQGALLIGNTNTNADADADVTEERMTASFRPTRSSLLSPTLYRCIQGRSVENGFALIELDSMEWPHRARSERT